MPAKLIVRVYPDERVEVRVEGLTDRDQGHPPEKKICKKVTERLERDLGSVIQRVYCDEGDTGNIEIVNSDQVKLGS